VGETWRVVLASGEVRSCVVEGHDLGVAEGVRWRVRGAVRATTGWSARAAVVDHIAAVGLPAVEILAPGEPTRAEAAAAVAAERDDLRAIIETRNAENAMLRSIIEGRTTPTREAFDALAAQGGTVYYIVPGRERGWFPAATAWWPRVAELSREGARLWAHDACGCPCAWPTVTP
jgi:hypothetical protein